MNINANVHPRSILTFISLTEVKKGNRYGLYKCKCGNIVEKALSYVRSGNTKSCGCIKSAAIINAHTTHDLSRHPLYRVWYGVKERCYNPKKAEYKNYGGVGVRICDEWKHDFKPFYDWAVSKGWRKGLELDKDFIPKKLGIPALLYSPTMCSFLNRSENNRSKRTNRIITYKGETKALIEWSEIVNIPFDTIWSRLHRGYSVEKALEMEVRVECRNKRKKPLQAGRLV